MEWTERAKDIAEQYCIQLEYSYESEYYKGVYEGFLKGIEDKQKAINDVIEWKKYQNNETPAFKPVRNKLLNEVQRSLKYVEAPED